MYEYIKLCCNGILQKYSDGYRKMTESSNSKGPSTSKNASQKEHVMVSLPKEVGEKSSTSKSMCNLPKKMDPKYLYYLSR
jgi:uncharacterized membrane protein YfhO